MYLGGAHRSTVLVVVVGQKRDGSKIIATELQAATNRKQQIQVSAREREGENAERGREREKETERKGGANENAAGRDREGK